jgi:starch synthase
MSKFRVLFATMEIDPFLKLSSAADFIRMLPEGLQEKGHEIRIMMPKFGVINERRNRLHEVVRLSGINIRVGNEEKPLTIKVATIPNTRLQVYFLDNEDYFQRKSVLTDAKNAFHRDNDERAIFFCKGVIETVKKLGWTPDIVHCHGWMTSLIPLYLKTHFSEDPIFRSSKIVYTVYDDGEVDCPLPDNFADKARLEGVPAEMMAQYSDKTFLGVSRGGIQLADAVTKGTENLDIRLEATLTECEKTKAVYPFVLSDAACVDHYDKVYHDLLV